MAEVDFSNDDYELTTLRVDPGQSSLRIDKYVLDKLEKVTRSKIQKGIKEKRILVNNLPVKANYLVRPNDEIQLYVPRNINGAEHILAEDIPLDIRYEDEDVMIVFKPPGMVVHPGISNSSGTLVNALAYYFKSKQLPIKEGNLPDRPGLVHRIDKDTSGLLVIAKNTEAMTHLSKQFYDHTIVRQYEAIVWGGPKEEKGTINEHIGRSLNNRTVFKVYEDGELGKHAITHYEVLEDLYYVSRIRCVLETGRTHQIRVHMKYLGHPIFSDAKYGGDKIVKGTVFNKYKQFVFNCFKLCTRQALHARKIGFIHPRTEEYMEFEADLPEDMAQALEKWRSYVTIKEEVINNAKDDDVESTEED